MHDADHAGASSKQALTHTAHLHGANRTARSAAAEQRSELPAPAASPASPPVRAARRASGLRRELSGAANRLARLLRASALRSSHRSSIAGARAQLRQMVHVHAKQLALAKVLCHAAKHLTSTINGLLVGTVDGDLVTLTDAIPLFHTGSVNLAMPTEVALAQVSWATSRERASLWVRGGLGGHLVGDCCTGRRLLHRHRRTAA